MDWKRDEHLMIRTIGNKKVYTVDNHQYALLTWAETALQTGRPYVLVSIDFHPDTNPPFWLMAYQKAMAIDPDRADALTETFSGRQLARIDPGDLTTLIAQMPRMRNDEHINTAMALGYLRDYHMINCMEEHHYQTGTHYLVEEAHFGSLKDAMFAQCGFDPAVLTDVDGTPLPYILDVDLDYFMREDDLTWISREMGIFGELVKGAACITSARSVTYFDYLKKEAFDIADCEKRFEALLQAILEE